MDARYLGRLVSRISKNAKVVIASNREPVMHERDAGGIRVVQPASGMVVALDPIVRATGGVWVAHGSGTADRLVVDSRGRMAMPPEKPRYTLRRVWLTRKEENGYYFGLSNRALWPLCHIVYTRPRFSRNDWEAYRNVNRRFCDAILEEVDGCPAIVFIQDYHLALLPRLLRQERPDLALVHFWHIPWPNREAFRIFPWGEELLDGLLGNDIMGFHIQYHCNNFMDTVDRGIEAKVDYEQFQIFRGGRPTHVRAFPISVDFRQIGKDATSGPVEERRLNFIKELGDEVLRTRVFVGADRIDYTKGIPERIRGFDLLLKNHPELREKVTLLQLAAPSRTHIEEYRDINDKLDDLVDEVNWRHQTEDWMPIRFLRAHHDYQAVLASYRLADILVVTSLHDGMNLVAKEFISARNDGDGVLLLSRYTGAARELADALLVNPYDTDELADAMYEAYIMPEKERRKRMRRMRSQIRNHTVFDWGGKIFEELEYIRPVKEIA
ncbi:MAG: trehalose-6-phosphate synthase [Pseudomonadota bacterium]|nr:trehalose-6-phosphate synthase [Syntrophobacterales bacterium]MDI9554260.1 trehalose-6-phosphate synthase [Pseudomonadota bacterium]NLX32483.1 trehalose-6-phosphate synthase [Deltaproteobacteria bacterium]HNU86374.1 trehalose-6-phosphate synthase [Syntrophales bacterium]HNZ34775.1 trehalose-6-phosphate synthase [Syntrophales bacterium]